MNKELEERRIQIKENISKLINNNQLTEAKFLIEEYKKVISNDIEIYSMEAIVFILEESYNKAEDILEMGLYRDQENFDLLYNLAFLYEITQRYSLAYKYYNKAFRVCNNESIKEEIHKALDNIKAGEAEVSNAKKKMVFFDKGDDKFIWDIINELSKEYEIKKVTVRKFEQIDEWMEWADICWFEWCDELIGYGSKLNVAKNKKVICRLHRYESMTNYPKDVIWENVDKLIIVTDHIKKFLVAQIPDIENKVDIVTISNGVNLDKYKLIERRSGFNIAYVGYIHNRKNPVLLLQIINNLVKIDSRYKLYIAGQFQDSLIELYFNYQIEQMGLQKNIIFEGWQNNIDKWLENKNYILSTSIHESFGYGIAEAMSMGIKPIIHNFVFSQEIWGKEYTFNSIDEAVEMIHDGKYNSKEYRKFIDEHYSSNKQIIQLKGIIEKLKKDDSIFTFIYEDREIKFYLPYLRDWVQKIIYETKNFYEVGMLEDIKNRLGINKVVIDIGANIGNHTVFFSTICNAKKVYSFEPQKNIFEILKKNIELNKVNKVVELYNMGLGKEHNFANITVIDENNYGMSKLDKSEKGTIEINSLDKVLDINRIDKIDMIKIDVEGMEIEVLEGAKGILNKFKPIIYIEAGTDNEFKEVSEFLSKFGYKAICKFNATPTYLFV